MIVAGCDVGSLTGKAVIMGNGSILAHSIVPATVKPEKTATNALEAALDHCGIGREEISFIVGTGYGRVKIPFADSNVSEITCHGKGAHYLDSGVRTIIDVGGQDCKVIKVNETGKVIEFAMNDKCAAGTGRFLETMARALELELYEMGCLSCESVHPVAITTQCSVFAETEVVSLLAEGTDVVDIVAGIHDAVASRIMTLVNRVGLEREMTITGGVAKNRGVVDFIQKRIGLKAVDLPLDPQIIGALGAALLAERQADMRKD
jgi:predicted CoA-substrate-specific enzyme activase